MKIAILLSCLVICGSATLGQQSASDPYSVAVVKDAMDRLSSGIIFGWDERNIPSLGDGCAIAILKIVDEPDLAQVKTVRGILRTIHLAFSRPEWIKIKEDRKPKITLFLLNYLKVKIHDPEMQSKIEETTDFVRQQSHVDVETPARRIE